MSIQIDTRDATDIVDVTEAVAEGLPADVEQGSCTVFVPHTTAGVVLNENEPRLLSDIEHLLATLAPRDDSYEHDAIDDNAASHLQALLLGESVSIPVVDGDLALGTWQSVLFVECDGPRTRSIEVVYTPGEQV